MKIKLIIGSIIVILIVGLIAYTIHQNKTIQSLQTDLRSLKTKQSLLIDKERLIVAKNESDSLRRVINSFTTDTVLINQIKYKYDTTYIRVIDSSYIYQLQWYRAELNRLYPD